MTSTILPVEVLGTGYYVPPNIVTNHDYELKYGVSPEWIKQVTGVEKRHIATPDLACSDLARPAAELALKNAGLGPEEIDLIILTSMGPDFASPPTSAIVQGQIGAINAGAFDLDCACLGFPWAFFVAANLINSGGFNKIMLISSELGSRCSNYNDPNSFVLLGDGAGAAIIGKSRGQGKGILSHYFKTDGKQADVASIRAWGSRHSRLTPEEIDNFAFNMQGKKIYKFATAALPEVIDKLVGLAKIAKSELSLVIPHQANRRIIEAARKRSGLPEESFFINIQDFGNTGSATIAIAFAQAAEQQRLIPGKKIILAGFGAGLSWGGILVQT
ncbi:MAG: ketoacyl-ACP synthase III [Candidatus Margulisbacteria bacterium]|nr:ketoacyl-ACP synthase III [Candidatus Margulisiibacteriota bacterium]MBU1617770.1 ketoacyl-ACP synthase III [Candidatus Margulisiibacteriota bacterium]